MSDNDLEIEGLIDSIRGQEPSQQEPELEPAEFVSVEEVMAGPSMASPSPLMFGHVGPGYAYPNDEPMLVSGYISNWADGYSNNNLVLHDGDGPSITFSPNGTITMSNGNSSQNYTVNIREQAEQVAQLRQRVAVLEQLVNMLGTALNAQIDNEVMSGLADHDRQEIRRMVAERNANQQNRERLRSMMRQQSLYPPMRSTK